MTGGDTDNPEIDISKYLLNFNSGDWSSQANTYLQNALQQGLPYSEKYSKLASDTLMQTAQQSAQQQQQGFQQAQALQAPQRLAAYNALDAYQDMLGLSRPNMGSYQFAQANMNPQIAQAQLTPPQWNNPNPSLFQGVK